VRLKVMELLWVKGWANRDVAAFLQISEQQVANYRFAAVKKLSEHVRAAGLPGDVFPELKEAQAG
jgi:RNA polymerase sigma-70 factor, ECF subfamily